MKKKLLIGALVGFLTLSVSLTGCGNKETSSSSSGGGSQGDTIKIGALFNLSGDQSSLDTPALNGAKLAVKEINAKGGVLGKKIELDVQDGKTDQTTCTNAISQMINVDKVVAVTGLSDSNYALAAGPIAQNAKIPFLTSGATLPTLPDQVGDYFFLCPFGDNVQAYAGAEFAYNDLHAKKAYILTDKAMDYTVTLSKYFKERFTKLAGPDSIVLEDSYQTSDVDFKAQITRLKALSTKPDVLYVAADPSKCGVIAKQMRDAGVTTPILGGDGYDTPLLIELGGKEGSKNVYFTTHASMDNPAPVVQNFVKAYQEEYKKAPENAFAMLGYDAIYLLADAIKRANSTDPTAIRDALAKTTDFKGVTGTIAYKDGQRVPTKSVTILTVKDGKFAFVKEVMPQ